ncbi:uncharacterized protein LOC143289158 [Babylonia areolata]|uniref:uncharacterized protein LOC143289158 n=1 Tax=Babylonia areolata TaxID=304850 RepID=UPI003FD1DCB6
MADHNREQHRERDGLPGHPVLPEMSKGESLAASSTSAVDKSERGEEDMGTQSLPQTYCASPPLVPQTNHPGVENLPQTAITTVYATTAQPSYGESVVHRTFAVAGHQSYLNPDVGVSTADSLPEQIAHVCSSMPIAHVCSSLPLRNVNSTMMAQADYVQAVEPIDFRRSSVSHSNEVGRMSSGDGDGVETSGVPLAVGGSNLSVPYTSDVTRGTVPDTDSFGRVTLPQTADITSMTLPNSDVHRGLILSNTVSRASGQQTSEVGKISTSETKDISTRNILGSVQAGRLNEPNIGGVSTANVLESEEIMRRNAPVSDINRRNLPSTVSRGNSQDVSNVSQLNMASLSGVSTLGDAAGHLSAHEAEKVWITVPVPASVTDQSLPYTNITKMTSPDAGEGSRMAVSLSADIGAVNTLNACETGGITVPEAGNVRTVVMSQMDDFSRMSLSNTGGVVSTTHTEDGSHVDAVVSQAAGMHSMDIKYSDLLARSNLSDVGRISVLQTHGGYTCEDDRLSLAHLQETGEVNSQHTVDTKPIILPQTGDVGVVTYPHVAEGISTMALPQAGNFSMVILPHTGDVSQMSVGQSDLRRIDLLPGDESNTTEIQTADGSRMNIQQNGNVIRIIPVSGDTSRLHMPHTEGSYLHIQADESKTILPQTSDIRSTEVEDKVDLGKMIALQNRNTTAVEMQQKFDVSRVNPYQSGNILNMTATKVTDASALETQQVYDVRTSEISAGERLHMFDVAKTNTSQVSDMRSVDRQVYHVGTSVVSQAADISAGDRQRVYNVDTSTVSQAGETNITDRQQVYGGTADQQQMNDTARQRISQTGDISNADGQQMYVVRTDPPQAGDMRALETASSHRVSVPHTSETGVSMHQAGDNKMTSAPYSGTDSSMMTLPQTSGVRIVNVPGTEDAFETGSNRRSVSYDIKRMGVAEQPHPEYINMRVMAEAAEIISRGSVPADDINMRLMAETADFVSRNVPQTTVINTSGSLPQTPEINIVAGTPSSSITVKTSQTGASEGFSTSSKSSGNIMQQDSVKMSSENRTVIPRSVPVQLSSANVTRNLVDKGGTVAPANQKTGAEKWKQRAVSRSDKEKQAEQQVASGFRAEFLKSQSYIRWRDIGNSQGLKNDEEIACFLMTYYDNTSGVFPSGRSACSTCHQQLSVSCVSCPQKAANSSKDANSTKKDNKKDKGSDDRTKLWKLIMEANPKEKGGEKAKEEREKRHRRKPRQTRRVLRRRVIVSGSNSSADDSQDEQDSDSHANESPLPTKVHFEQEQKTTPAPMVTRKRGRPSNDSYHQVSTLECSACQRKFHTAAGLDQHVKRKRCKAAKTGALVSDAKEPEKSAEKSQTPLQFKCDDCGKEYRSKQGLLLHRVSKHGEENERLQMALPEGDDGDDTDEYVPDEKDKLFECTVCNKQYRSKQGLLMHKASKHSEVPAKKIKLEEQGENDISDSEEDSKGREVDCFKCNECNKTYNSRPGYILHMKTKHFPMIMRDCPECDGKFKTKVELRIHIRREHNKGRLVLFCPYCPLIFHSRENLRSHMDDSHKTCRRVLFDCIACDLQFSSRIERKRHIQSEHKGKDTSLTCHFCGSWFATRHEYDEHEKAGHPDQTQEWLCAICGDSFPTRYLLQRHALTHKEKILCSLCNKYITEPCYEDHMKRHYGNKTWKCEQCSKSFIRKAELQQHTLVHKDERPFCCELCGMRYREKSRLNSHMRTHTGVKPYKCQQCEKCFTRSRELKNHMRVHTGEKPFACTVCGRRFASSGNLSAHRRKVHKLEPIPHGQQSRKHTLEERIKPENKFPTPPPPPVAPPPTVAPTPPVAPPTSHESPAAAHSSVTVEVPLAHSAALLEVPADHGAAGVNAPVAHGASLTLQAPMAHQAPVAHQDQAVTYQQHMIAKYEPLVTQPDHYIPQPAVQPAQSSLAIYWPNTSYGEES